jgi:ketosteroid isomerase-like protein
MRMRGWAKLLVACVLVLGVWPARADDSDDIKQVLTQQVLDWNRGDVDAFMQGYKNSPDTTFIGKSLQQGWAPITERYKTGFPSKDAMGTLSFTDLSVRMLGTGHAVVTGKFHLVRNAAGGGDAGGIFSLVFEKTAQGWKIILDHTTTL